MKVYVDELPETCWKCPCFIGITCRCKLLHEYLDECGERVPEQCPLQSLSDYTKQVRKEAIEKLKIESPYCHINCEDYYKVYPEILEKIIGEADAKN